MEWYVLAVYEAAVGGPSNVREKGKVRQSSNAKTYRWYGHHAGDPALYRTPGEKEEWMEKCPIKTLRGSLLEAKVVGEDEIVKLENEVQDEIKAAVKFAQDSEYPDAADAFNHVYAD